MEDPALREDFARDVVLLKYVGLNPVVVHGGGPEITALHGAPRHAGRVRRRPARVSDEETVEVAKMVLVGKVNKDIVLRLEPPRPAGGRAVRRRRRASSASRAGRAGRRGHRLRRQIERVDVDVIHHIAQDYIPVIASVGADREGNSYNVNADEAAGAVARALGAYKVIFLTDVEGWLRDPTDPASLISEARADEVERGARRRRRRDAAEARRRASTRSTAASRSAHIVDGRVPHSLLLELFTDAGIGTKIRPPREPRDARRRSSATTSSAYARFPVGSCAARARACGTPTATSTSTS